MKVATCELLFVEQDLDRQKCGQEHFKYKEQGGFS